MEEKVVNLQCSEGSSDKVYNIFLTQNAAGLWDVTATYGKRMAENLSSTVIATNIDYVSANAAFNRKKREKTQRARDRYIDITRPDAQVARPAIVANHEQVRQPSQQNESSAHRGSSTGYPVEETRKIFI